jgi:kynurenine formamidase
MDRSGSNWGRWGAEDERGALNLQTPARVLEAARRIRTGRVYPLGLPIGRGVGPIGAHRPPPVRLTMMNRADPNRFGHMGDLVEGVGINEDVLVIPTHSLTHMDALAHVFAEGTLYNGWPADAVETYDGATRCGIDKQPFIAGRALFLDVAALLGVDVVKPPHVIIAAELLACASAADVEIEPGDALIIRTGWLEHYLSDPESVDAQLQAGLGYDACQLIHEKDVAAVGADNTAIESKPFDRNVFVGIHVELLHKLGVPMIEHLMLGEMAADRVTECLLVVAPLLITGGMGSPVNPIAIA